MTVILFFILIILLCATFYEPTYRGRGAPFSGKIGDDPPWYKHTDGKWYDFETHERVDVKESTFEILTKEVEEENQKRRAASRKARGE